MRRSFLTFCVIHLECCVCGAHKRTLARFFSFIAYRIAKIRFTISFECMVWHGMYVISFCRLVAFLFHFFFFLFCCCLLSFVSLDTKIERQKKNTSPTTTTNVKKSEGKTKTYENDVITDSIAKT